MFCIDRQPHMEEKNATHTKEERLTSVLLPKRTLSSRPPPFCSMDDDTVNVGQGAAAECLPLQYKFHTAAPHLEEKNATRRRRTEAIRKVGIRPFNAVLRRCTGAPVTSAHCRKKALNGRTPTLRLGWWPRRSGVFFFHVRPCKSPRGARGLLRLHGINGQTFAPLATRWPAYVCRPCQVLASICTRNNLFSSSDMSMATGCGPGLWPRAMAPGPWPPAMAPGRGPKAMAPGPWPGGHGWPRGHGFWLNEPFRVLQLTARPRLHREPQKTATAAL